MPALMPLQKMKLSVVSWALFLPIVQSSQNPTWGIPHKPVLNTRQITPTELRRNRRSRQRKKTSQTWSVSCSFQSRTGFTIPIHFLLLLNLAGIRVLLGIFVATQPSSQKSRRQPTDTAFFAIVALQSIKILFKNKRTTCFLSSGRQLRTSEYSVRKQSYWAKGISAHIHCYFLNGILKELQSYRMHQRGSEHSGSPPQPVTAWNR